MAWRALVGLVALAVILPGLWTLPVTDRDEARFAQASKQMLETGDLIDIRLQDAPRWKKPIGIYWLQAASARPVGGGAEAGIWAYRLPSAAAALACGAADRLGGAAADRAARRRLAGIMLATTLLAVVEGHIAKTDAALLATAVAALGALARLTRAQVRSRHGAGLLGGARRRDPAQRAGRAGDRRAGARGPSGLPAGALTGAPFVRRRGWR